MTIFGSFIALFVYTNQRATTAPARVFQHDVPIAPALDRSEHRRRVLAGLSYWQLLLAPIAGFVILARLSEEFDIWDGWGRTAWLLPIGFTTLAVVQAWRKRRSESSRDR